MNEITLIYPMLTDKPAVPGYLMDVNVAMHYDGQLWLCTVVPTDKHEEYSVSDYIALTRKPVDLMELFVMLRDMSAISFIIDYLFHETAEVELFPLE